MQVLQSKKATLAVLVVALVAQVPHAAYVFSHIGDQKVEFLQRLHGYSYAVALEIAVLLFVVRGRQVESYGFALVSVLINICYYNMHGVSPFQLGAFPAWLVSVALPVAIACYSHDIAHEPVAQYHATIDSTVAQPSQQIEQQEIVVAQPKATAAERRAQLAEWLRNNITVNATLVAQQFEVSPQLIRKELKELRNA